MTIHKPIKMNRLATILISSIICINYKTYTKTITSLTTVNLFLILQI